MFECRVERDSVYEEGSRLTSFVITYPRIVLAEAVTHRLIRDSWGEVSLCERAATEDISKNSASSRAIPFSKMMEKVKEDPFMPFWTTNKKGMQGDAADSLTIEGANSAWLQARDEMVNWATILHETYGIHKQDCNRLLEPFAWVTQIVTSSRWDNFFALRCHHMAHPSLRKIARMMFLARRKSTPTKLAPGQWHLPFVPFDQQMDFRWCPDMMGMIRGEYPTISNVVKYSAARCAWISYENHDKESTSEALLRTWDRLFAEIPVHASPVEHQATPMMPEWQRNLPKLQSNLTGWLQARKLLKHEEITEYSPSEQEINSWGE